MKAIIFMYAVFLLGLAYGCSGDDTPNRVSLTIKTVNVEDNSPISGAKYHLTINDRPIGDYVARDGTVVLPSLPLGSCVIEEVAAPYGYYPSSTVRYVLDFSEKEHQEVVFQNKAISDEPVLESRMEVSFWDNNQKKSLGDYTAIRIGEYYWVNHNFRHVIPWGTNFENDYPVTQSTLDLYLERARLDKSQYQLSNINDFEFDYGRHYGRFSLDYMYQYGDIHARGGAMLPGWGFPSPADYEQLFAMCPFNTTHNTQPHTSLNEFDVRFALAPRRGESRLAFDISDPEGGPYKTYWFEDKYVTAVYDFNLMPGGMRLNGPSQICNQYGPAGGCYPDGQIGDIHGLFYVAALAVRNNDGSYGGVGIHDWLYTDPMDFYHMMNVRWCRPLTAKELGYTLYINSAKTDIKKLGADDPAPSGYSELPHGYLRGFYVQYILDKPNTKITVADIVQYEKNVHRNY